MLRRRSARIARSRSRTSAAAAARRCARCAHRSWAGVARTPRARNSVTRSRPGPDHARRRIRAAAPAHVRRRRGTPGRRPAAHRAATPRATRETECRQAAARSHRAVSPARAAARTKSSGVRPCFRYWQPGRQRFGGPRPAKQTGDVHEAGEQRIVRARVRGHSPALGDGTLHRLPARLSPACE